MEFEDQSIKWCVPPDCKQFEGEYLTWLLPRFVNENLVIYSDSGENEEYQIIAKKELNKGRETILIHLSDESYAAETNLYQKAKLVIRSYFKPGVENAYAFPLGFQTGYMNNNEIEESDKEYTWVFIGQVKNHRKKMLESLAKIGASKIYKTEKWMDSNALTVGEVKSIYKKTIFIPCPFGNINPDSYRIMEALECGCIPVVTKFLGFDYFKYIYGDHPFLVGKNWNDCARLIQDFLNDASRLKDKKREVMEWYSNFKKELKKDAIQLIVQKKPHLLSRQFTYQKDVNIYIRLCFFVYFKTRGRKLMDLIFH